MQKLEWIRRVVKITEQRFGVGGLDSLRACINGRKRHLKHGSSPSQEQLRKMAKGRNRGY